MSPDFDIEVFFDGGCPLCRREMNLIRCWDRRQRLRFTDIDAETFDPAAVGKTRDELMAEIHGRLPDGSLISGVEVFRRLYSAVGFRWLVAPTRLPGLSWLCDVGYRLFARNRLKLTGRCKDGVCAVPVQHPVGNSTGAARP
jgi:predicted DCC family thiol-disulfide oxidoreductase YuxK